VHDAVTLRHGSWHRTVAGLERALAANLPVRVGVIETVENKTHLPHAIGFLTRLGIREIGVDGERRVGRGRRRLAADTAGEDLSQLCGQCGRSRLCLTSTGAIYPCVFSRRTPLGDARDGLRSALEGATLAGFRAAKELEQRSRRLRPGGSAFCEPGPPVPIPYPPDEPQPDTDGCGPWERRARPLRLGQDRG
jgi:MoaA/NifB/PqqE/SkfB family radical SAM enzyme